MGQNPPLSGIRVSITVLSQMFLYLDSLNIDKAAFLRSIGLDPDFIQSPDTYIPIETYLHIQDSAAEYTNDPSFGLHMGEYAEAGSWSILGYLMMNCKTLGEAFEKSGRYQRIIGNLIEGDGYLRFNKAKMVLYTPPHAPKMSRHCFESTLSSSVRMIRTLTGKDLSPVEVTFIYPEPEDKAEYERIFKCPVLFGQKDNSIMIPLSFLNTPIMFHNPELLEHFENYAQKLILEMENPQEYTREVTKIILSYLDDESLTIRKVAKELSVSVRTLQNRLKEEGVVFSDLLTDIRERLAKKYLRENMTVEEITYLLGYSEPSSFRKAFKKWAGITPKEFRESSFPAPI